MRYSFPLAFAANAFSMTALLVVLGLTGRAELAADAGIVQAATVMLFFAFSANARNLVLNPERPVPLRALLLARLGLLVPLSAAAYALSTLLTGVEHWLATTLIARRCAEWINELHLSERELASDRRFAGVFTGVQGCLFFGILGALTHSDGAVRVAALVWAVAPALWSARFVLRQCRRGGAVLPWWRELVPHLGSTVAIGVSVYAFRVLILGLVGKSTAGDLFTAYAIGGMISSVFATAVGPTFVFQRQLGAGRSIGREMAVVTGGCIVAGLGLFWIASTAADDVLWLGKSALSWKATGLSLAGGGIMLLAQLQRLELLQSSRESLFGPDVLSNLAVVSAVPVGVLALGEWALQYAYLWNAAVVFVFYAGVRQTNRLHSAWPRFTTATKITTAVLVMLPVFVTLGSGLFRDPHFQYDTHGQLSRLPIPLSVFACYAGILLLGKLDRARRGLTTTFAMFLLMVLPALAITAGDLSAGRDKLLLMIQYLLPVPALILGQQFAARDCPRDRLPKIALGLVAVLAPLQVVGSLWQGSVILHPHYGLFSIHQQLQYVPMVIVGLYLVALFALFDRPTPRLLLAALGIVMGAYVTASLSRLAMGLFAIGLAAFVVRFWSWQRCRVPALALSLLVAAGAVAMWTGTRTDSTWNDKFAAGAQPDKGRWEYWQHYAQAIADNPQCLLVGSLHPPARAEAPSAHNYYLDVTYNFGLGAALPVLVLLAWTMRELVRHRRRLFASPDLLGLSLVVLLLAVADNTFKVTFRQPYPGIAAFFLWGTLLARLAQWCETETPDDGTTAERRMKLPRPPAAPMAKPRRQLVEV